MKIWKIGSFIQSEVNQLQVGWITDFIKTGKLEVLGFEARVIYIETSFLKPVS